METNVNTSPRFLLRVPSRFRDAMLMNFQNTLPNECCGLLAGSLVEAGTIGSVSEHYLLTNELQQPDEFASDPRDMLAAVKDMRTKKIDILAVYHSHPTSTPLPSRRDRERNYSSHVVNLIIGLVADQVAVRGWWLTETEAVEAAWEIFDASQGAE